MLRGEPSEGPYFQQMSVILYLESPVRPDTAFAVGMLECFRCSPKTSPWIAAKCVLIYLAGTRSNVIIYCVEDDLDLVRFAASEFSGTMWTVNRLPVIYLNWQNGRSREDLRRKLSSRFQPARSSRWLYL